MIKLLGDFTELERFVERLEDADAFLEALSESMAESALNLISDGFKAGRDPYGNPWDAPNNLQITGRLRSYTQQRVDSTGFTVGATDQKAAWHHSPQPRAAWGGKSLPVRLQVPVESLGLPAEWSGTFEDLAADEMKAWLER